MLHDEFPAGSGDFVFMPKDVAHSIALASPPPVRFHAVATPSGFEHSMEDMSQALAAGHDRSAPEVAGDPPGARLGADAEARRRGAGFLPEGPAHHQAAAEGGDRAAADLREDAPFGPRRA